MTDETSHAEGGLLPAITRLLETLRDVVENRVELIFVEWQEERLRLFDALLLALVGAVCALMALILFTVTIVVVFWETHRVMVLVLLTLAYAGAAAAAFGVLRSRLRRWQAFSATVDQLKKDRACFGKQD
jgi:uncharacterized membrane protein YqjE